MSEDLLPDGGELKQKPRVDLKCRLYPNGDLQEEATRLLWAKGWTEGEISIVLRMSLIRIREYNVKPEEAL